MSEPSGFGDSPDTVDDGSQAAEDAGDQDATLTTDDEAQREDSVTRPGNEPD